MAGTLGWLVEVMQWAIQAVFVFDDWLTIELERDGHEAKPAGLIEGNGTLPIMLPLLMLLMLTFGGLAVHGWPHLMLNHFFISVRMASASFAIQTQPSAGLV